MTIFGFPIDAALAVYVIVFFAPFVQEDAAVFGAASAAAMGQGDPAILFAVTLAGLTLSDLWKYWAGAFAKRIPRFAKWVNDPRVLAAREGVLKRLGLTLLAARFVPGTRIPLYVACGVFHAPFGRFSAYVILSGALYIGLAFALLRLVGEAAGERVHAIAPFVAIGVVALVIGISAWRRRRKPA